MLRKICSSFVTRGVARSRRHDGSVFITDHIHLANGIVSDKAFTFVHNCAETFSNPNS